MAAIAWIDLALLLDRVGFPSGDPLVRGLAVVDVESARKPDATNTVGNNPPSTDRGLWQLNSYWHAEVADACAFDPECASRAVLGISKNGSDYSQWVGSLHVNDKTHSALDVAKVAGDALARIKKLQAQVASLQASVDAVTADRDTLADELDEARKERDAVTAELDDALATLEQIGALADKITNGGTG